MYYFHNIKKRLTKIFSKSKKTLDECLYLADLLNSYDPLVEMIKENPSLHAHELLLSIALKLKYEFHHADKLLFRVGIFSYLN